MARDLMAAVEQYLRECFDTQSAPRVDELAQKLCTHPSVLSRTFKTQTGRHLSAVMKERQIEEAKRLLRTTDLTLASVAMRAGFGTINTFFRLFRAREGRTPGSFRLTSTHARKPDEM